MYKKRKVENILIIVLALILIIITIIITYLNYRAQRANRAALKERAQNQTQQNPIAPTAIFIPPTYQLEKKTLVKYDVSAENLLLEKIQNRKPLSENDNAAIKKMLYLLLPEDAGSGTLYTSPNLLIEYNGTLNILEIEIKTTEINLAKEEAVQWLLSKGLSRDAICNYPVEFYLNWDIVNELKNSNITFNTLPPNCQ